LALSEFSDAKSLGPREQEFQNNQIILSAKQTEVSHPANRITLEKSLFFNFQVLELG